MAQDQTPNASTPASARARRGRRSTPGTFTPEKKSEFIDLYCTGLSVRECANLVGVSTVTVFNHIRSDADFAARYRQAMEINTDHLEDHLFRMATQKMPGNILAVFGVLKARRPDKWRESARVEHTGKIEFTRPEDLEAARQRARHRGLEALN
jgi:AcrR family transcriptional regulator